MNQVIEIQQAARFRSGVARASAKWGTWRAVMDQEDAAKDYALARRYYRNTYREVGSAWEE